VIRRVAYLSIHTSPLATPGSGDAGGMNVYVHELAQTMARRGVEVDVYTRGEDGVVEVAPGYRVVHIRGASSGDPAELVGGFAEAIVTLATRRQAAYDVVHSHYWLSGWAGLLLHEVLKVPLAISFHTLGRVKDANRRPGDPAESLLRIAAEAEVIARAGCIVASTPVEAGELIEHYRANPERLCVSPPGVDHERFSPGSREEARRSLGLGSGPLVLFVGRVQPLKGPDIALDAFAAISGDLSDARLMVVGGPSGVAGTDTARALRTAVARHGLEDRVRFVPAMPHDELPAVFRAADVVVVPSRSESFGLVAAEAQSCGVPVVAARVGGLPFVVEDGVSGLLVEGWDPAGYAAAVRRVLTEPGLAAALGAGAVKHAEQFSWPATADRLLELYRGITHRD